MAVSSVLADLKVGTTTVVSVVLAFRPAMRGSSLL